MDCIGELAHSSDEANGYAGREHRGRCRSPGHSALTASAAVIAVPSTWKFVWAQYLCCSQLIHNSCFTCIRRLFRGLFRKRKMC
jgi:hypothetical protein